MSSTRDPNATIKLFLDEGLDELPDRSYDAVRTAIDQTRQWAVVGPWKEPQIMTATRFALIAAAIAVVAVVAIRFLPSSGGIGGGIGGQATATPVATTTSPPTPTPVPVALPSAGAINPGTYYIAGHPDLGIQRLTFSVPAGWTVADFIAKEPTTQGEVLFTEWAVKYVFQDACKWDQAKLIDTGTTVDQLVSALISQKSRTAGPVTSTSVDGFPAKQVTLTVDPSLDTSTCTDGNLRYWAGATAAGPDWGSGMCCNLAGNIDTLYVVDVNGRRIVLIARQYPNSTAQNVAELQSVVNSVQIEP